MIINKVMFTNYRVKLNFKYKVIYKLVLVLNWWMLEHWWSSEQCLGTTSLELFHVNKYLWDSMVRQQQYHVVPVRMSWVGLKWDFCDGQAGPCMGGCMDWCMGGWWLFYYLDWSGGGVGLVRLDLSLGGSCCGGDVIKMPMFEWLIQTSACSNIGNRWSPR